MAQKVFTIAFDASLVNQDGMRHRILNLEDDLKGEIFWREKIGSVSGLDDGEDKTTIIVQKKRDFAKAIEIIEKCIKHHLNELNFLCKDGCYEFVGYKV